MPTAAAVIIGDEILTGKFADENGPFLIERLRTLGTDLRRLAVIADDLDAIAREVADAAERFDFVFTTGGVGPTHDDMTLEGVARAFDLPLYEDEELIAIIEGFGLPLNSATRRMATVPEGAVLVHQKGLAYPVVTIRNVYVFPGVPKLFKAKFEVIADRFAGETVKTARLYVDDWETRIAERLADAQRQHPEVNIGSYPRFGEGDYKVIITLESRDEAALEAARARLEAVLETVSPK